MILPEQTMRKTELKDRLKLVAIFAKRNCSMYTLIAKANKLLLPSFTKQQLDLSKATKWQMAIIGWRYFVTKKALGN